MPINEKIQSNHAAKKQQTLSLIQDAINELQEDGQVVTKKALMEITGLSSGTFSKEHVKELLKENKVCQFRDIQVINEQKSVKNKDQIIDSLMKENERLKTRVRNLDSQIDVMNKQMSKYNEIKKDLEEVRGKYQEVLEAYYSLGGDIGIFKAE